MKSLLVFASLMGLSLAQHWGAPAAPGVPADTPEVAAAKASHLAALARANQAPQSPQQQWNQPQQQWNQPQQQWSPPQQQWNQPQQRTWTGPVALPPGFDQNGAPLPVQDTPEVAAEKAKHFNIYSNGGHPSLAPAQPSWNSAPQQSWNAAPQQSWNTAPQQSWNSAPNQWNAPSQPGLPQDTPEVAAARAAHLAAHAALPPSSNHQQRWKRSVLAVPVSTVSGYSSSIVHSAAPVVATAPLLSTRLIAAPHHLPISLSAW